MKIQIHLEGDEEKLRKSAKFLEGALLELIHTPTHDDIEKRVIIPVIETKVKENSQEYSLVGYNITDFDKEGKRISASYISMNDLVRGYHEGFPIS